VPLGQPVTVRGLKPRDTYVFAVAAYDAGGEVIGGLGDSSPQLLMAHPLPLYGCWAQLLLTACQLGCAGTARRAARVLLPHFIERGPERPVWEANPADCLSLHRWGPLRLPAAHCHLPSAAQRQPAGWAGQMATTTCRPSLLHTAGPTCRPQPGR
jgi:hypothetical protein